jgi:single-stranded DNA-binding protein
VEESLQSGSSPEGCEVITIMASGYCPRQPELRVLSENTVKCEFEVLSKRNTKEKGAWVTVVEAVTFVAWNDQARTLSEHLTAGREISATGRQETNRWEDATGPKKRVVYRLTDFEFGGPRAERGANQPNAHAASSDRYGQPPAQRERPPTHSAQQPRYARPMDRQPPAEMQRQQPPEDFDDTISY